MAIHPLLQGIEVAVCVNRAPLLEYEDDESWPGAVTSATGHSIKTITKYIESTEDQEFGFMCKIGSPYVLNCAGLNFQFTIDGTRCRGMTLDASRYNKPSFKEGLHKQGHIEGKGYLLPFKFTKIETTLSANSLQTLERDKKVLAKSGQIMVEVFRTAELRRKKRSAKGVPTLGIEDSEVHEKALKGHPKYHGASLGNMKPDHVSSTTMYGPKLDGRDSPILRFTFKYRSKKALKELLIIERSPEPEAGDERSIPGINSLDDGQRQKVAAYVRDLKNGSGNQDAKVKREHQNGEEPSRRNKKPKKSGEVEFIDLTED